MEGSADRWGRPGNAFAFHNWWHTALYHMDQGDTGRALAIYDTGVRPAPSQLQLEMVDAVAFLWRMHLRGLEVGERWRDLADTYARTGEAGFRWEEGRVGKECDSTGRTGGSRNH